VGPVVATLTRRFGDLDIAEEAAAEALATAVERWPVDGLPLTRRLADQRDAGTRDGAETRAPKESSDRRAPHPTAGIGEPDRPSPVHRARWQAPRIPCTGTCDVSARRLPSRAR